MWRAKNYFPCVRPVSRCSCAQTESFVPGIRSEDKIQLHVIQPSKSFPITKFFFSLFSFFFFFLSLIFSLYKRQASTRTASCGWLKSIVKDLAPDSFFPFFFFFFTRVELATLLRKSARVITRACDSRSIDRKTPRVTWPVHVFRSHWRFLCGNLADQRFLSFARVWEIGTRCEHHPQTNVGNTSNKILTRYHNVDFPSPRREEIVRANFL